MVFWKLVGWHFTTASFGRFVFWQASASEFVLRLAITVGARCDVFWTVSAYNQPLFIPVEAKQITNQIEMNVGLLVDSQSNVHKTCSCGLAIMNFI